MIKRVKWSLLHRQVCWLASLKTHYELLGVGEGASFKEVKEQYLIKSKMYHPDVSPQTHTLFQDIQAAYKVLNTPQQRKKYDLSLGIQNSAWEKQIIGQKFSSEFQSEDLYQQILKDKKEEKVSPESMEEKLQKDFKAEIEAFSYGTFLKSFGFIGIMVGVAGCWVVWNGVQIFVLGYKGEVKHEIEQIHTETALKVVPLVSR